jgi:uncharacterized membrane protein
VSRARVWAIPATWVVGAALLAQVLVLADRRLPALGFVMPPSTALSTLGAITSGMIAFTGIVFSMMLLLVQFSSTAYSPRVAIYLLDDPVVLNALGAFAGTFVFSLVSMVWVDPAGTGQVPTITVLVAVVAVLVSVAMFIVLLRRVAGLRVGAVLAGVANRGRRAIDELLPARLTNADEAERVEVDDLPEVTQVIKHRGSPGVLARADTAALVRIAGRIDGLVELVVSVGDAMASGEVVARVRGATRQAPNVLLRRALVITVERTIEQDPKYAIRLLVDIAIRALSPAVNDPTTAVMAIDHIEDMLRRIAGRRLEQGHVRADGRLRLVFPTPSWEDLVALATDEIRIYGARSVQVMRRLLAMLAELLLEVPEFRRGPLVDRQARVRRAIDRNFEDPDDRAEASQADTQGLGLSRG